jgi:uncharacterized membrane protein YgaE (UPF0421/DUF939 family)
MTDMDLSTLSDRAWERGRLSLAARLRRLRDKAWMIGQCAVAAGAAWAVATGVFGHPTPFFASIAAVLCLGTSYGQRLRRVVEVSVGCALGIGIADVFRSVAGSGAPQIVFVVAISMTAAILLDAGVLLINQAAVQAIVVITILPPGSNISRVFDALIGGGVALVAATIVPGAPLRHPREQASRVIRELARLLREARASAADIDTELAEDTLARAREIETLLNELRDAAREGLEVVRTSPFRRGQKENVRSIADIVGPLDRAIRNTRVLIRRIVVSARLGESMPPDYLDLLDRIADAEEAIADLLATNQPPYAVQQQLTEIAEATSHVSSPLTLSAAVVLGQTRSLVVDLLELAGVDPAEAGALVPRRD